MRTVILAITAGVVLGLIVPTSYAGKKPRATHVAPDPVTCIEPMTTVECFPTRTAPCTAPVEGSMSPGCTYVGILLDGRQTRFLFQDDGTGYTYTPVYNGRVRRVDGGRWELQ